MKFSCLKIVVYALLIFAATTVVSCVGSGDKEKSPDLVKIDLDAKENVLKLSEIADTVTFVALETNEQSRFGNVDKLMIEDDKYIVVDKELSSAIFVFDLKGHFLCKIGQKGNARNEYIELTDATLGNGNVYVYDAKSKKIVCYSMDGTYKETYPFEYTASEIKHIDGDRFAFYCSYSRNMDLAENDKIPNVIIYDVKTKELKKDMMFETSFAYEAIPVVPNNLNPYLYGSFSDEVYAFEDSEMIPIVKIDYGSPYNDNRKEFLKRASLGTATMSDIQKSQASGSFPMLINFMNTGNAYFAFCVNGGKLFYNFQFHESGKTLCGVAAGKLPVADDMYGCIALMPKAAGNGNLYLDVDPSASSKLKLPIEAGPDANPLIATIKLRTDI